MMVTIGIFLALILVLVSHGYADYVQILLLIASLILIYCANLPRNERHLQWLLPLLAFFVSLLFLLGIEWLRGHYANALQSFSYWISLIHTLLNLTFPPDLFDALPVLNILFLMVWGIIKIILMRSVKVYTFFVSATQNEYDSFGAYVCESNRQWYLQPKWNMVRHFTLTLTFFSILSVPLISAVYLGELKTSWVPILPTISLVFFGEVAAYLGGLSKANGEVSMDGDDANSTTFTSYEKVWRSMHKTWPKQWMATGKRAFWIRK